MEPDWTLVREMAWRRQLAAMKRDWTMTVTPEEWDMISPMPSHFQPDVLARLDYGDITITMKITRDDLSNPAKLAHIIKHLWEVVWQRAEVARLAKEGHAWAVKLEQEAAAAP